jgi:CO/xanthine dehydrogenase Mo-binding subunit
MNSPTGFLPQFIIDNPRLGDWFAFASPGSVILKTGKVEIGQGILTALRQIAAEELDLPLALLDVLSGDTTASPQEGPTVASLSITMSGPAIRVAASELRGRLFEAAAARLAVPTIRLTAIDGVFHVEGAATQENYWTVASDIDLNDRIAGAFRSKDPDIYRLVGTSPVSSDLLQKLSGAAFIHDFAPPRMVHGRALRLPHWEAKLVRFDLERARAINGVIAAIHDGNFIGIVTESEHALFAAMDSVERLVEWDFGDQDEISLTPLDRLSEAKSLPVTVHEDFDDRDRNWQYAATFTKPLIGHGSIGPSCAVACFENGGLSIWTHSQNIFALRAQVARVIDLPESRIAVRHMPAAGCYGHNGADDVAMDAVLLARAVPGRPVRAQWSRHDELRAEPLGSPMSVAVSASLQEGRIVAWNLKTRSGTHVRRPGWGDEVNLLAAAALNKPWPFHEPTDVPLDLGGGGGAKNSVAGYDFPQLVSYEFVPNLPFRVSSMRSLGAFANVLAIESSMDDLAAMAGRDAIDFRLAHLTDPRSRKVIETVVAMSDWHEKIEPGQSKGLGFAQFENESSYCAVVAHVSVEEEVRLLHMWAAVDAGLAINPGGIIAQVEGGMIQAASWTLKEAVPTEGRRIISESWKDYPILRFDEIPGITVHVISSKTDPSMGVGEVAMGPTAGAIANAVARALGVRIRDLPITRDRIIDTIMNDNRA